MDGSEFNFGSRSPKILVRAAFCVVASRIERSEPRCVFCVVFAVLLRSRRGHDAKSSNKIEKAFFSEFLGPENRYFRWENQKPMKN